MRLEHIRDHFTYSLYCNICRSLFEKDKLLFACLLNSRILGAEGKVDPGEWLFLLTGGLGSGVEVKKPADADWITTKCWNEMTRLSKVRPAGCCSPRHPTDFEPLCFNYRALSPKALTWWALTNPLRH